MRGFQVLKGIVFDETLADVYTVDVEEVAKDAADGSITCDVRVWSSGPPGSAAVALYQHRCCCAANPTRYRCIPTST
ncbi:MAG: hypothetical protein HC893_02660 [Chloroflexaceae bacterium]|nr:hypothetical protein [Chloroflexaceae bacterium]